MKEFASLDEFTAYLEKSISRFSPMKKAGLELIGQRVEDTAKRKLGVYQEAVGEFEAWQQLAESTQRERERLGYSPNDPLYRRGDLMQSISHNTDIDTVVVASDSEIAVWQELGTDRIPPRPFLAPAMLEEEKYIKAVINEFLLALITGDPIKLKRF